MKLMLVDDSSIARDVLRDLVQDLDDITITAECASPEAALVALRTDPPDVILLDIEFPQGSGMDVLSAAAVSHPWVKVLVVSNHAEPTFRTRYASAGAYGFHDKSRELRELRKTLFQLSRPTKGEPT